jgi:hypothetical protein
MESLVTSPPFEMKKPLGHCVRAVQPLSENSDGAFDSYCPKAEHVVSGEHRLSEVWDRRVEVYSVPVPVPVPSSVRTRHTVSFWHCLFEVDVGGSVSNSLD